MSEIAKIFTEFTTGKGPKQGEKTPAISDILQHFYTKFVLPYFFVPSGHITSQKTHFKFFFPLIFPLWVGGGWG